MKIYNYAPGTGLFISVGEADPSPMEPGAFLLPAFATFDTPGEIPGGHLAFFDPAEKLWAIRPQAVVEAVVPPAPVELTFEQRLSVWRDAVRAHANTVAQAHDFDSIDEAVSYADEPAVPAFQVLGRALRTWRSWLWQAFDELVRGIRSGELEPFANEGDLRDRLPAFGAPAPVAGAGPVPGAVASTALMFPPAVIVPFVNEPIPEEFAMLVQHRETPETAPQE